MRRAFKIQRGFKPHMRSKITIPAYVVIIGSMLLISTTSFIYGLMTASTTILCTGTIAVPTVPWLHTSGTELYDSNNNTARLFAVDVDGNMGFPITQADITNIKNMGFKAIRLIMWWGHLQPTDGQTANINTRYFSDGYNTPNGVAVDNIVNWCNTAGLYVILGLGWTSAYGPPSWAVGTSGVGFTSWADDASTKRWFDWTSVTLKQGIANLYAYMANRYKDYSSVVFADFNEISTSGAPPTATQRQNFADWNNNWITAVENNEGTSHIKINQLLYCDDGSVNYCLYTPFISGTHSNVIVATHCYPIIEEGGGTQYGVQWVDFIHNTIGLPWTGLEESEFMGGNLSSGFAWMINNGVVGCGYFDYEYSGNSNRNCNVNNPSAQPHILAALQPYMNAYQW
jgi:hypothetical protein